MATPLAPAPPATADDLGDAIDRLFEAQRAHRAYVRATTWRERAGKLRRLREAVLQHRDALKTALHADFRKAPEEVDLSEIMPVLTEARYAEKHLKRWMAPTKVGTPVTHLGTSSEIRYEPKGVGLIISPWNYPVILTLGPLVSAIAAGCPVIIKPSEFTPHTSAVLKTLLADVFPPREVAIVEGDASVAQALLDRPFDHIYFTGSPEIGKKVMTAASRHLASVTLELGGKSPTIVDATADVEEAARKVVWGKFTNTGQTCIAPDYVYVHDAVFDRFVEAAREHLRTAYGASDADRARTPDYARLIHDRHAERMARLLDDATARGARIAEGGTTDTAERFVAPTLLTDVPMDAEVMQEEIFGPLLPVLRYHDLDAALQTIERLPRPLALYVFSQDDDAIERVLAHTTAGGTCINETLLHFNHPELPFGGVNTSGIGKGYGHYGFLEFTNQRAVLRRTWGSPALAWLYPPYGARARKLIDGLLNYLG